MRWGRLFTAAALLLGGLACGGGSGGSAPAQASASATSLAYADPTDTSRWRLVRNASSTGTRLVLDLLGPAGGSGMGVTLELTLDGTRAGWVNADGTSLVKAGGIYLAPLAQAASIQGSTLRILLSQENPASPVSYGTAPVLSVALDLKAGAPVGEVTLAAARGGHLAAGLGTPQTISLAVGTVRANP